MNLIRPFISTCAHSVALLCLMSTFVCSAAHAETLHAATTTETSPPAGQDPDFGTLSAYSQSDYPDLGTLGAHAKSWARWENNDHVHLSLFTTAINGSSARARASWSDVMQVSGGPMPQVFDLWVEVRGSMDTSATVESAVLGNTFPSALTKVTVSSLGQNSILQAGISWSREYAPGPGRSIDLGNGVFLNEYRGISTVNASWNGSELYYNAPFAGDQIIGYLRVPISTASLSGNLLPFIFSAEADVYSGAESTSTVDFFHTSSLVAILLPDGSTPESHGYTLSFESGMISPNLVVPELNPLMSLSLVLPLLYAFRLARQK